MSTRKPVSRLLTIKEFHRAHPEISEHRIYWAMRHRKTNGLRAYVYRKPVWGQTLFLDESPAFAWFNGVVPA